MFRTIAHKASEIFGSPKGFFVALLIVLVWSLAGPYFGYSDTWQLVINTGTTIVTFLMIFLVQNTQNRDARAIHIKLDEIIRSLRQARNALIDVEDQSDQELAKLQQEFADLSQQLQLKAQLKEEAKRKN